MPWRPPAQCGAKRAAERFRTRPGPWFDHTPEIFDIIVSNPPYIRSDVVTALEPEVVRFDPMAALDGGMDGLDAYRAIAASARSHLRDHGIIGLEIGFDQRVDVTQIFDAAGFSLLEERRDYGGNDRVLVLRPSFISPFAAPAKDNYGKHRKRLGFPDEA